MARSENTFPIRYKMKANLVFPWGVSVGADEETSDSDTPILQINNDQILVPGTSIAGVIRGTLHQMLDANPDLNNPPEIIKDTFGFAKDKEGKASRLKIHDVVLNCNPSVRDGVGIDRETGAARDTVKFDREYSVLNCNGPLLIELDGDDETKADDLAILKIIHLFLENGLFRFGGGRDAGLATTAELKILEYILRDPESLHKYITNADGNLLDLSTIDRNLVPAKDTSWLNLRISFNADSPLLSNSDRVLEDHELLDDEEKPSDHTPLRLKDMNGDSFYVIPGTSLRGVFRQQLEMICRHKGEFVCDIHDRDYHKMSTQDKKKEKKPCDCAVCKIYGNSNQSSRINFGPATMQAPKDPEEHEKLVDMVAINRFSGGAMEQHKFNARVITDGKFSFDIVMRDVKDDDLKLLFFLLRDFSDGFIPLGFGTRKGWGDVSDVKVSGKLIKLSNEGFSEIDLGSLDDLKAIIPQYSEAEAGS